MQNTSARPLWPLHAVAIPLIAVLGWLIYDEKSRDFTPEDTESLAKTLVSSRELMERSNWAQMAQTEKTSKDYPSAHNDEWFHRAERAAALSKTTSKQLETYYNSRLPYAKRWVFTTSEALQPNIGAFADSLISLAGSDSVVAVRIRTCLFDENITKSPTWVNDILKQNNTERRFLYVFNGLFGERTDVQETWWDEAFKQNSMNMLALCYYNLMSKITLAEEIALRNIAPKVCADQEYVFDAFEIGLVPGKTRRIHPGEPFEADVYLESYSRHSDNIRIFANNKQLPVENGKALFSQIYRTPGEKIVDVRIEIRNPTTGQVERVQKEFSVEVLPKCDPKH